MDLAAILAALIVVPPTLCAMVGIIWYARAMNRHRIEKEAEGWECVGCPLLTGPVMVPPTHPLHSTQRKKLSKNPLRKS